MTCGNTSYFANIEFFIGGRVIEIVVNGHTLAILCHLAVTIRLIF